ncbi:MAG: ABC transporter ATP-binding protein [Bacteroidales bacterium]
MITIYNIKKSYNQLTVYDNFSLGMKQNEISCILGPSGCGKTTLLNMIGGITSPDAGYIELLQNDTISYIFQEPRLLPWKTVLGNIRFVLNNIQIENQDKYIRRYLKLVGLDDFSNYYPHQLSGGMKQRVSIARAFIYPSNIILMDEPLKTLDPKLKWNLMKTFIKIWRNDKRTVIFVTHDVDEALILGNEIFIFSKPPVKIKKRLNNKLSSNERQTDNIAYFNMKKEILNIIE